ncbi:MAG: biopolymer transporter ExbD [Candidatus Omnitrophica bacterium]|nr:biopolymer transporter ExbD [Candidatus Omnitrophota bacterium]
MEFEERKKVATNLNIAPLIDVIFLLLIFFMLSSHFVVDPGIKITLPDSVTALPRQEKDIIVFITEDDVLYLDGEEVGMDNLSTELKIKIEDSQKKTVVIKADEKVDLGLAVKVMDLAREAGSEGLVVSAKREYGDAE